VPGTVAVANVPVALDRASVPAPPTLPAFWLKAPPLTLKVWPAATVMVPVLVKLGAVLDWDSVRSPPVTSMVPLLAWCADAALIVSPAFRVSVPWLSSWALSVRAPPVPTWAVMVAPGALVSVPAETVRLALKPETALVSSTAPRLVKPLAKARSANPWPPPPSTRKVEPAAAVTAPLRALLPSVTTTVPPLTSAALTVARSSVIVPWLVSVPVPLSVRPGLS
jgi:hypothetical protein